MKVVNLQREAQSLAKIHGVPCAAWIAHTYRRQFRKTGAVVFKVYRGKLTEAWATHRAFFVGFEQLRYSRRWHTDVKPDGLQLQFCVYYLGNTNGRKHAGVEHTA
jgi:hypothetical protein